MHCFFLLGNGGTSAVKLFDANGSFIEDIVPSGTLNLLLPNAVVLRDVTPVSIASIEIKEVDFIQPTIGVEFYLSPSINLDIQRIEIYNQAGVLIEQGNFDSNELWNAGPTVEGMYYIVARTKEGESMVQKVFVKKE